MNCTIKVLDVYWIKTHQIYNVELFSSILWAVFSLSGLDLLMHKSLMYKVFHFEEIQSVSLLLLLVLCCQI